MWCSLTHMECCLSLYAYPSSRHWLLSIIFLPIIFSLWWTCATHSHFPFFVLFVLFRGILNTVQVTGAWAGHYEFNTMDHNGIVGRHPYSPNLYLITGFSGHGLQQSPAAGNALSELILDGKYSSIDLSRFGFDRFLTGELVPEKNVF